MCFKKAYMTYEHVNTVNPTYTFPFPILQYPGVVNINIRNGAHSF